MDVVGSVDALDIVGVAGGAGGAGRVTLSHQEGREEEDSLKKVN